jgi:hypothetical protein
MPHTPTPWELSDVELLRIQDSGTGDEVATTRFATEKHAVERHANAAHIVRCVNAHDALVAFHDAWTEAEVAAATGNPDVAMAKRAALLVAHHAARAALEPARHE